MTKSPINRWVIGRGRSVLRPDDRDGDSVVRHPSALAVSLVSAGVGVAPMTVSPFAAWLISHYDWRIAMATPDPRPRRQRGGR
jgi:hypothetical protein